MELRQRHQLTFRSGFTLVEVLVVMAILGIIMIASASGLVAARHRAELSKTGTVADSLVHAAQQRAVAARDGRSWGVTCANDHLQTYSYTDPADATEWKNADQLTFNASIRCSGPTIQFQKLTGIPESDVTVTLSANGKGFHQIQVAQPGVIHSTAL